MVEPGQTLPLRLLSSAEAKQKASTHPSRNNLLLFGARSRASWRVHDHYAILNLQNRQQSEQRRRSAAKSKRLLHATLLDAQRRPGRVVSATLSRQAGHHGPGFQHPLVEKAQN